MAFDIDKYFRVMRFLKDNPIIVSVCRRDKKVFKGKLKFCPEHGTPVDHISLQQYMSDETLTNPNRSDLLIKLLDWDPINSLSLPKEFTTANTALESRDKIRKFFGHVIIPGSFAYNTNDIDRFRQFLVDWSSTARTFKDLMLHASDAFSLDDDDIDKAIRGFGIDFVNKKTFPNLMGRQIFLLALTDLYKIKGSPDSIINSLQLAGLSDCIIKEYWIERLPESYRNLQIRGIAANKWKQVLVDNSYQWDQKQTLFDDTYLTWGNFDQRMVEINDPHWWYTKEEIVNIDWDNDTWLKLPSMTPYFGIEYCPDLQRYNVLISMIEKILSSQFNEYLQGRQNLIPKDIGIDGYNENLSKRDVWIDGYNEPLTLLETFLGWVYSQIRFDEYTQYMNFKDFLRSKNVPLENEKYRYPWAYQELIYSIYKRIQNDELIDNVIPLSAIVKMFPRNSDNYYCATNELISWWIRRPLDSDEYIPHTPNNIPPIFFDAEYPFLYQLTPTNTDSDRILFYNGFRNIDFNDPNFEYEEVIQDYYELVNRKTARVEYDNTPKSYHASNRENEYLYNEYEAIYEYLNTYYQYISNVDMMYFEKEEHDGSELTPYYVKKYPKPQKWNWAVDSTYFYYSPSPTKWVRTNIETSWSGSAILPDSVFDGDLVLGHHIYDNGYVYIYASLGKWVRYQCETDWEYCESPILKDGSVKIKSDIFKRNIKAKIPSAIAHDWLYNRSKLLRTSIEFTLNPSSTSSKTYQYSLDELTSYINRNLLVMDENGYIFKDFNIFYHNNYIYHRMFDLNKNIVWIRVQTQSKWNKYDNGLKIYQGDYRFPNLDLTNRYDAERILRGKFVLEITDLNGLDGSINGGEILVSNGTHGHPEVWVYNESASSWEPAINKIGNIPGYPRINQINLGFNNNFIQWMDQLAENESKYGEFASTCLNAFSNYIKFAFNNYDLDIANIYKNFGSSGLYRDLINFFKPKRARLLYLTVNVILDNRLFNSIKLYDEPESTKLIQQINDYVPRQDLIFIQNNDGLYKKSYHQDDRIDIFEIPRNSKYGDAVFYASGFDDERVNGFYFERSDLGEDSPLYFLNDSNICLTLVRNESTNSISEQWIISERKKNLDRCDLLYTCYDENYIGGSWYKKNEDTSETNNRRIIRIEDLTSNDIYRQHFKTDVNFDRYNLDVENAWNSIYPREEPSPVGSSGKVHVKTLRSETSSIRHWGPALCKDPYNIRTVFPSGILGHPENLEGSRISGYDSLNRVGDPNSNQEEPHSFLKWKYLDTTLKVKGHAAKIIDRDEVGIPYQSKSDYNYFGEEKSLFAIGDGTKTTFKLNVLRNNKYHIKIYNGDIELQQNIDWKIVQTFKEYFIEFTEPPQLNEQLFYSYPVPIWWMLSIEKFRSGPVFHRPVYMAISTNLYDCYPCRNMSTCCDYFDVGCNFDGPTNPQMIRWSPEESEWIGGQYKNYNVNRLDYDEHTHHHRIDGYITNLDEIWNLESPEEYQYTVREHLENEKSWAKTLYNIGDTYCNQCDIPLFTPDVSYFELSDEYKRCGIYHRTISGNGFEGIYNVLNGNWTPNSISRLNDWDYPYGYTNSNGYQLVHVYHKPSGYHYWEVRKPETFDVILRSELKKKRHEFLDIIDEDPDNLKIESNNFLNGHDVDPVEDRWSDSIDDPSEFITEKLITFPKTHIIQIGKDRSEINQNIISGRFETSTWISIDLENTDGDVIQYAKGKYGQLLYSIETEYSGVLYICTESNFDTDTYTWKRVASHINVEHFWTEESEPYMRPNSPANFCGYIYKDAYLYLYISSSDYSGWIRLLVQAAGSQNHDSITNDWIFVDNLAYRYVSHVNSYANMGALDYQEGNLDEMSICGNIIPFNETFEGIKLIHHYNTRCQCTIEDEVFASLITYSPTEDGRFIKIRTTNSDLPEKCEHRFVPKEYEAFLPTDFNIPDISSIEHYYLRKYIPFYLNDGSDQKITWERDGNLFYNRDDNYYYHYLHFNWVSSQIETIE